MRRAASIHHMEQLLDLLFHLMDQDLRRRVMSELPTAYNAYVGTEIVEVVPARHGELPPPSGAAPPEASV